MPIASSASRIWALVAVLGVPLVLAWEASGADLALARWSGAAAGFALRNNFWLTTVLHDGARRVSWLLALALCVAVWWPVGVLRRIRMTERLQAAVTVLASVLMVSLIKRASGASCPWELTPFGGLVAPVSHWTAFLHPDGGGGHCFPAGHASAGFGFVGCWFALRRGAPAVARRVLVGALSAGFVLGIGQQMRGAHFMSHTLWSLWACWTTGGLIDLVWPRYAMP